MSSVYYVTCPACSKRYYLDRMLHAIVIRDPEQQVKCPFCKTEFVPEMTSPKKA